MDLVPEKRYLRMECVVFIEMKDGEEPEEAEDRFIESLPNGVDCVSFKSEAWIPE